MTEYPAQGIPTTTAERVIFPFDQNTQKWDCSFYGPQLTFGRASVQEIEQVLAEFFAARAPYNRKMRITAVIFLLTFMMFCSAFLYSMFTGIIDENERIFNKYIPLIVPYFFGFIGAILYFTIKASRVCRNLVQNEINPRFASRGLRWNLPSYFPYWVELHNDFYTQQQQAAPVNGAYQQPGAYYGAANPNVQGQLNLQIYQAGPQNANNLYIPPAQH